MSTIAAAARATPTPSIATFGRPWSTLSRKLKRKTIAETAIRIPKADGTGIFLEHQTLVSRGRQALAPDGGARSHAGMAP
jgi:hypothetical protein